MHTLTSLHAVKHLRLCASYAHKHYIKMRIESYLTANIRVPKTFALLKRLKNVDSSAVPDLFVIKTAHLGKSAVIVSKADLEGPRFVELCNTFETLICQSDTTSVPYAQFIIPDIVVEEYIDGYDDLVLVFHCHKGDILYCEAMKNGVSRVLRNVDNNATLGAQGSDNGEFDALQKHYNALHHFSSTLSQEIGCTSIRVSCISNGYYVRKVGFDPVCTQPSYQAFEQQNPKQVGVVITTFGDNYVYAKQCVLCFLRHLVDYNPFIVLYINGSTNARLLSIGSEFSDNVHVVASETPHADGLTGTWNEGISLCLGKGCDAVVLSNDDVIFDSSVRHLVDQALFAQMQGSGLYYFGPLTNAPGTHCNVAQLGSKPVGHEPFECTYKHKPINLNGFFMAFPKTSLIVNRLNEKHYFDPKYPYGGNEAHWYGRFRKRGGIPMVVPKTFVYHYKLKSWRQAVKQIPCLYTVNLGGYEGTRVLLANARSKHQVMDMLYFTDNDSLIYTCLARHVVPFLIYPEEYGKSPQLTQRAIKTSPHLFLPQHYNVSFYCDGHNILRYFPVRKLLESLRTYDIICYEHWRTPCTPAEEQRVIVDVNATTQENVDKVVEKMKESGFDPHTHGLTETNFLARNHHKIIAFSEEWTEFVHLCHRDQASFDFLLWKHKVRYQRRPDSERPVRKLKHVNPKGRFLKDNSVPDPKADQTLPI